MIKRLQEVKRLDALIDAKLEQVSALREMTRSVTGVIVDDKVQTDQRGDKLETLVIKIVDLENEINGDVDRLVDLKRELMNTIDQLNDAKQITILYKRYFEGMTWDGIAEDMDLSRQWVRLLHDKAIYLLEVNISTEV